MRASTAKQVLPTSGGSLTSLPSTRPVWLEVRQPPPWPQPPSSRCCCTSQARPFLVASLSGFALTAVPIGAAPSLGGVAGGSFLSPALSPEKRQRRPSRTADETTR